MSCYQIISKREKDEETERERKKDKEREREREREKERDLPLRPECCSTLTSERVWVEEVGRRGQEDPVWAGLPEPRPSQKTWAWENEEPQESEV